MKPISMARVGIQVEAELEPYRVRVRDCAEAFHGWRLPLCQTSKIEDEDEDDFWGK
jgi:hypothetical protein